MLWIEVTGRVKNSLTERGRLWEMQVGEEGCMLILRGIFDIQMEISSGQWDTCVWSSGDGFELEIGIRKLSASRCYLEASD